MKLKLALLGALFLALVGCSSGPPADFVSGTVIGKDYIAESWISVPISCGTNCTTYTQIYSPASYLIHVGWCDDGCSTADIAVEAVSYEQIQIGDTYPREGRAG